MEVVPSCPVVVKMGTWGCGWESLCPTVEWGLLGLGGQRTRIGKWDLNCGEILRKGEHATSVSYMPAKAKSDILHYSCSCSQRRSLCLGLWVLH